LKILIIQKTIHQANNHCNKLYEKAQHQLKQKLIMHEKKKKDENLEYLKYTYKPHTKDNKSRSRSKSAEKVQTPLFERHMIWEKTKNTKTEKIKEMKKINEQSQCTFKPNIEQSPIEDDEKFISRNIPHIFSYINRKLKIKEKKKEDEEMYKKKFCIPEKGEKKVIKKTIPKEFNLSSNQHKLEENSTHFNRNNKAIHLNQDINKIRSKLRTEEFFDKGNMLNYNTENTNNYMYEKDNNVNNNHFDQFENNENSCLDENKLAMAVNYLHQQLHQ